VLLQACLLADQPLLAITMSEIAHDFKFNRLETDEKLGSNVAIVYGAVGAAAAFAAGRWADSHKRVALLSFIGFIGGVATLATSLAATYPFFMVCRALAGISIGGYSPVVYSMLGDLFGPDTRPQATALFTISGGLGTGGGTLLAGLLTPSFGWRAPFVVVGTCAIVSALVVVAAMAEPERAMAQMSLITPDGSSAKLEFPQLLSTPTVHCVFLQGLFGCIAWSISLTFLPDYLAVNCKLGVMQAATVLLVSGWAATAGVAIGAKLGATLYLIRKAWLPILLAVTTVGGMLAQLLLIALRDITPSHSWMFYVVAALGSCLLSMTPANAKVILLNCVRPDEHGVAFGFYNLMDDVGKAFGPAIIMLAVKPLGQQHGFLVGLLAFIPCALALGLIARTIAADEAIIVNKFHPTSSP